MPLVTRELLPLAGRIPEFELAGLPSWYRLLLRWKSPSTKDGSTSSSNGGEWRYPIFAWWKMLSSLSTRRKNWVIRRRPFASSPASQNGSRRFRIIDPSADEHQLFCRKPGTAHITLDEAVRYFPKPFPELLLTEYLAGDEYSVDCLADAGRL